MKSFFKKSVISMFVMGMAGSAVAAHGYVNQAWSPSYTGFFIGLEGLDLRPENGDLDYVTVFPGTASGTFNTNAVHTGYQWGWRLYGGIRFTDNDDITLSWMRLNADDSASTTNVSGVIMAPRFLDDTTAWTGASARIDNELTDIYGVWGHSIHFNNPWSIRYAAGFEYAKIDSDLNITGSSTTTTFDGAGYNSTSHFKGFGPRVEFDMTYHLPYNFALFSNTNAALLVATRKIAQNGNFRTVTPIYNTSYFSTRHVVVPKFGERLGVSYTWIFGQAGGEGVALSALKIDAGWQVESYIHAVERPEGFGFVDGSTVDGFGFANTKTSNFGDQGFFIGLEYSSGVV